MNKIEKVIYDLVKTNPKLKNSIRDIYQGILSIVPKDKKVSDFNILEREGFFYGFHDKIPWSKDNTMLLAQKYNIGDRDIKKEDEVEIGYFQDDDYTEFKSLCTTKSWNWTQGSMLQWIGEEDNIIFNFWNGDKNVARIIDKKGNLIKELGYPIGAVDKTGKYALSYSFERLNVGMYGYGYANENDSEKDNPITRNSGLNLVDIEANTSNMLFSIDEIASLNPDDSMLGAYHFFTHCLFSPDGTRFLFLHRWYKKGKRLYSRMISSDLKGKSIHVFPTDGMVSHISWMNNDKVIAYCNTKPYGDGYFIFKDLSPDFWQVGQDKYTSDGHPQYCPINNLIVTDTYPDRFSVRELSIYDYKENEKTIIAKLWSPNSRKNHIRCDLHPRWDRYGSMICFDSAHTGKRALCTVKLLNGK
jgi:hypothetical protein